MLLERINLMTSNYSDRDWQLQLQQLEQSREQRPEVVVPATRKPEGGNLSKEVSDHLTKELTDKEKYFQTVLALPGQKLFQPQRVRPEQQPDDEKSPEKMVLSERGLGRTRQS